MLILDLIDFAKAYDKLDPDVKVALEDLINGCYHTVSRDSIKIIDESLSQYHKYIQDVIGECLDFMDDNHV